MGEPELIAEPPVCRAGELIHLTVKGPRLGGGLVSTLESLAGEPLYVLVAEHHRDDASWAPAGESPPYYPVGVGSRYRLPVRVPPLRPGRYVIRSEFFGARLPVRPIPADWQGDPEDHPSSREPTHETVVLTTEITVV